MLKLTAAMVLLIQVHTTAPNSPPRAEPPPYDWLDDIVGFFEEANKHGGIGAALENARKDPPRMTRR